MRVIGKQCLYLDPWALSSYFLPVSCWAGQWQQHLAANQESALYSRTEDVNKCVFLRVLSSPRSLELPVMAAWANSAVLFFSVRVAARWRDPVSQHSPELWLPAELKTKSNDMFNKCCKSGTGCLSDVVLHFSSCSLNALLDIICPC